MGELIDSLYRLQQQHGFLSRDQLEAFAHEASVPLYRVQELVSFYPHFRTTPPRKLTLAICRDVACRMAHHPAVDRTRAWAVDHSEVEVTDASCLGRCDRAPAAAVNDIPVQLNAEVDAAAWLDTLPTYVASSKKLPIDPYASPAAQYEAYTEASGDPRDAVIEAVTSSGLRGMGGAGFPTGKKWRLVADEKGPQKYVICNADESEPGTFKDRDVLARAPHLVLEGMLLAARAVGADVAILFIRHEYEPERRRFVAALDEAKSRGLVAADGNNAPISVRIAVSPGGYILGEETALLECLEDKRGEPRNKPPYPGQVGLHGCPTLVNNVETFAHVPFIVKNGAQAWRDLGTRDKAGLKLMAVSGDVTTPGVYAVAMGTSLRELVALAGGVVGGQPLLALAPGGASSNFVGPEGLDLLIDFDSMRQGGTMLGSGALLVLAKGRDVLDIATNLVAFFRNESCGKCVPCRIGSEKAVKLLEAAQAGLGKRRHLALLDEMRDTLEQTSICGLGQVALSPFASLRLVCTQEIESRFPHVP